MFFSNIARNITFVFLIALFFLKPTDELEVISETKSEIQNNESVQEQETFEVEKEENNSSSSEWVVEIPKINLKAEISEGTDAKVMDKYIGHFEETPEITGNVGLAAHNRGYPVNYFKDLKQLEIGDKINYKYFNVKKTYVVDKIKVIKDTNWELLKNTKENRLTLITCIENEPEYRLCVQAIEIGGNYEIEKINNNTNDNDNNNV